MKSHHYPASRSRRIRAAAALAAGIVAMPAARAGVDVEGLDERQEANVRAYSALTSTDCDSARWRVERLFRDADNDVRLALQALGYYDPEISKSLAWDDDCWQVTLRVEAGEPVRYRDVDIDITGEAASDPLFLSRITDTRPTPGAVLDHGAYTAFKNSLLRSAAHTGYFDGDFEHSRVTVDRDARAADVDLRFLSGSKYRFGEVHFTDGILRPKLLAGYTDIEPGDPYTAKAINELYEALNGSNYFASVSIRTEPLDTGNRIVPVNVMLTPAKRRLYSVGGGYTTDTGPHGRIGYVNRRINDRGHQFESKLFGSAVRSELDLAYRWPKKDPRREWFSIVSGYQHEDTDTARNDTYKVGLLLARNLGENWLATRYVDYAYEDFRVADQTSISQLIIFGINFETARGRALSRVTDGYRFSFDIRGANDSLGSDTSFLQLRSKAKWVHALNDRWRVLARTSLGTTVKDALIELPASVRFFAGGDRSVRGYRYESLGPVDGDGEVIGGSNLIDGSLELDFRVHDQWSVAAFVDSGSAFNGTDFDFSTGVGLGVRWYSPVGPIRLDFAHPLDDPDRSLRIHISLGPDL